MASAALTSKGQVTIPKPIREYLKVKEGDRVDFVIESGRVVLRPGTIDLRSLKGVLRRPKQRPVSLTQMETAVSKLHAKRR